MPNIAVLDQSTINKIAAGEVIERPSSVVKELVENAIDAGATAVTVEIKDGGTTFIRITDNGCGIEKNQVQVAFLRHSTSKIKSVEDLLTISSLGFRGEALSSICAVSQVELITKTAGALTGVRYMIDGGKEKSLEEIGAPDGTTFIVRNLFYNTPARRKFLKTATTEGGYISDLIEKLSLSHPEISFRFISNGQNKLYTSGNGNLKDVIYGVYGREITANLLPIKHECDLFSMEGFIGKPILNRGNRTLENYYINGRYIKSNVISKAIEDAYSSFTMPRKYPFTSIHFTIDSNTIDINVHPTKMELRFSDAERVYKEIFRAIYDCLSHRNVIPEVTFKTEKKAEKIEIAQNSAENKPIIKTEAINAQKTTIAGEPTNTNQNVSKVPPRTLDSSFFARTPSIVENKATTALNNENPPKTEAVMAGAVEEAIKAEPQKQEQPMRPVKENKLPEPFELNRMAAANVLKEEPAPYKAPVQMSLFGDEQEKKLLDEKNLVKHKTIGQLFDTYWLVEFEEKLYIIDQHAAHEKVLYEKFVARAKNNTIESQQLMPPEIITLTLAAGQVLKDNLKTIQDMGFEIESFGGNEYAIRAVPVDLYGSSGKDMVLEIIDDIMINPGKLTLETIKDRIATMACKAAVKGNNRLKEAEVKELIRELLTLENPYNCPHGRPTMISMSKYELEKRFKRII